MKFQYLSHMHKSINMHGQLPTSGTIGLNFGLNLYLHIFFVYMSIEDSCEFIVMCRLN